MSKATDGCDGFNFLNEEQLIRFKTKATCSSAWFEALQRIDRVLLGLTIRVVGNIRSAKLAKVMLELIRKLEKYAENSFSNNLMKIGLPLSKKITVVAKNIGNVSADCWMLDSAFAVFLGILKFNNVGIRTT